jgi:5'-3' exonuclease
MSTAAKLLRKYGSIEEIFKQQETIHKMQIHYAKKVQDAIAEHHDRIQLAQQLSVIKCDIAEANTADILQQRAIDQSAFRDICQQLGLTTEQQREWAALIDRLYSHSSK